MTFFLAKYVKLINSILVQSNQLINTYGASKTANDFDIKWSSYIYQETAMKEENMYLNFFYFRMENLLRNDFTSKSSFTVFFFHLFERSGERGNQITNLLRRVKLYFPQATLIKRSFFDESF